MEIQKIALSELKFAPYNPRVDVKKDTDFYNKLKNSIESFGIVEPLVFNKRTGNVVGGNQRLAVLIDLGIKEVEVVVIDLPLDKEKILNIALNRIQGNWDIGCLTETLVDLEKTDFDLSLTGFTPPDIDIIMFDETLPENLETRSVIPLSRIMENTWSGNEITSFRFDELKKSIKSIGLVHPVIVRKEKGKYRIIDGNSRYRAYKELGNNNIPCRIINVSEDEGKALSFTLNRRWGYLSMGKTVTVLKDLRDKIGDDELRNQTGISNNTLEQYTKYEGQPFMEREGEVSLRKYGEQDFREVKPLLVIPFSTVDEVSETRIHLKSVNLDITKALRIIIDYYLTNNGVGGPK